MPRKRTERTKGDPGLTQAFHDPFHAKLMRAIELLGARIAPKERQAIPRPAIAP